jgi:hypothetical protein
MVGSSGVDGSFTRDERLRFMALAEQTATAVAGEQSVDRTRVSRAGPDQSSDQKRLTLAVISAQRKALLDARDDGRFPGLEL